MILVLGDINVDVMAPLAAPLVVGEDCPSRSLSFHCGGVGANVAMALAGLETPVRLVGCTGNDWFADYLLARLSERGIDTNNIRKVNGTLTGMMFIAVGPDGQRTIFGSRGANCETPQNAKSCLEGVSAVEIAGYVFLNSAAASFAENLIRQAKQQHIWTALDVGSTPSLQIPDEFVRIASVADTLFANASEALAVTRERDLLQAFRCLEAVGCEVVLKMGQHGCQLRVDGTIATVPPFPVEAVDSTGAGDAFTAAFMAARQWGWSIAQTALFANAAGAASASLLGAGENMPEISRIEALLGGAKLNPDWEPTRCRVVELLGQRQLTKLMTSEGA